MHLKVKMGFSRMAGVSAFANPLPDADTVADPHGNAAFAQMGEKTELVAPMLDQDVVSANVAAPHVHRAGPWERIVPVPISCAHDDAVGWRKDRLAEGGKIKEASASPP